MVTMAAILRTCSGPAPDHLRIRVPLSGPGTERVRAGYGPGRVKLTLGVHFSKIT